MTQIARTLYLAIFIKNKYLCIRINILPPFAKKAKNKLIYVNLNKRILLLPKIVNCIYENEYITSLTYPSFLKVVVKTLWENFSF